jgi:hypothetical protein
MSKKINEIPFWGVLRDCFPEMEVALMDMNESEVTDSQWLTVARWWRNALLSESDWSQVADNSLTEIKKQEWRQYRQTLRDIPNTYEDPKDIIFPDMPSSN